MDTKTTYLWTVICPKKLTLAHNVFEVTKLCRTGADILKPSLDRSRSLADHKNINKILNVEVIALICGQKNVNLYLVKSSQKLVSKKQYFFKLVIVSRR